MNGLLLRFIIINNYLTSHMWDKDEDKGRRSLLTIKYDLLKTCTPSSPKQIEMTLLIHSK